MSTLQYLRLIQPDLTGGREGGLLSTEAPRELVLLNEGSVGTACIIRMEVSQELHGASCRPAHSIQAVI